MTATDTAAPAQGADRVSSAYPGDFDSLASECGCERTDAIALAHGVRSADHAGRLLPGALRQACARLAALRQAFPGCPPNTLSAASTAIEQAHAALQPGPRFSLESAERALGEALVLCRRDDHATAETRAALCAQRAAVAAIRQQHRRAADLYAAAAATAALGNALQWRYQYARAAVLQERGNDYADTQALVQAVELFEQTVAPLASRDTRPDEWSATQQALGMALSALGQRRPGIHLLQRAVAAFEQALQVRTRERAPQDWAASQHGLGNALGILAQRQGDAALLERAVVALEHAAGERAGSPRTRVTAQFHLATALVTLGQLTRDSARLARAIETYRQVLQTWTRDRAPLDWAMVHDSLGSALRLRGELGNDRCELEQAVAAHRNALAVWTQDRWPREWSQAQNNCGAALHRLGERTGDSERLREAIDAYGNALRALRRDDSPIAWAMTTANLGDARRTLAGILRDNTVCRQAIADFEAVAAIFQEASHPHYYDLAKERLAVARKLAAELGAA